ncbi:MAG: hypothetical protein E7369_00970 [Clostridiales bacterium]|nr:hypothetical protein [Clostridiales bacterium]
MFKKLCCVAVCMVLAGYLAISYRTPIFERYSDTFTVYLNSPSSLSTEIAVDRWDFLTLNKVYGESFVTNAEFDLQKLIDDFSAKLVLTESGGGVINYYFYSPMIKYKKSIKNQAVNLHVAYRGEVLTIGSPIIFGSF